MNCRALSSSSICSTRNSVERQTRETNDAMMMVKIKNDAILIPSGRS